ncbi:hypothetical protein G5I_01118 [Acromyrmex echinatior]|uniref:Uncharacterized protein n=1 Tax=Acromyrmex echinatior TaxID=103372 RepID=F4W6M3_ACREC|nr:hypothetical protein G5I_01118 [Acromyrmex echinatior]
MIVHETANNFARKRSIAEDDEDEDDDDDDNEDDGSGRGNGVLQILAAREAADPVMKPNWVSRSGFAPNEPGPASNSRYFDDLPSALLPSFLTAVVTGSNARN